MVYQAGEIVMKKNRTREYVHDRLYALAAKMLERHNPCHGCIVNNCFNDDSEARCCEGCPYFKEGQGCTVQALYCKLWLCSYLKRSASNWYLMDRMHTLQRIAEKYGLLVARASREETLEFGERLATNPWWLYDRDWHGRSRRSSHNLLRRTAK